ncbi:sensor domain-containing diguanylate cyclase [Janthinobacterium psychrotolerans]|uniref:PAS domain S-box-containing protein/diguanylate cyclase (GGDEF) domain-containing protein n=1 Tax=Janthinobacterium psychrotolerans TaxID=1747903 RepID=A0A1A7BZ16_9BURK|nr:sensor domain-containing diguanylate cyclase [Janthinobacterium psychrotolerans]OBV37994.1 PAS domain S-box-containing protein/diguanylate cyclase (GGDEF) domain-containing protein [Janthinobacterium psychrotolerans]
MNLHAEAGQAQPRLATIDVNEVPGAPGIAHAGAMHGTDVREYEALLQFLYMAPAGLVQLGADGAISMLNPLAAELLMPLSQDGGPSNLFDVLALVAPDLKLLCRNFHAPHGQICDAVRLYLHADGTARGPQVLSLSMLKLDACRLMAVLNDITAQDRRERQLRNADAWLNAIMTNITNYALVSIDRRGRIESWNDSIGRVTGYGHDIKGQPYALFYPAGATAPAQLLDRLRETDENGWSLDEGVHLRADGSQFWGSSMISPLPGRPDEEAAYCLIIRDISDNRDASDSLRKAAYCDHLTGLSNRRAFFEAAELELMRRKKALRPVALIMLDADHFKAINDRYGHPAGDAVLCQLAATMKAVCRQVDVLARIGGEEFAIILPSVGLADAFAVAERLRTEVEQVPVIYEQHAIACTISLGVAVMEEDMSGFEALIKRADQAMYEAKHQGRNRTRIYS